VRSLLTIGVFVGLAALAVACSSTGPATTSAKRPAATRPKAPAAPDRPTSREDVAPSSAQIRAWWGAFLRAMAGGDGAALARLCTERGIATLRRTYDREAGGLPRLAGRLRRERLTWDRADGRLRLHPVRGGDPMDEGERFVLTERGGKLLLDDLVLGD